MKHLLAALILTLALASGCAPTITPGPMKAYDIHIVDTGNAKITKHTVLSWGMPTYYYHSTWECWVYCIRWPNGCIRTTTVHWGVVTDVTESPAEK